MTLDALGLKGQPAFLACRVSKVPKAEREDLGFQASQVHQVISVKEALQGSQANQDRPGL